MNTLRPAVPILDIAPYRSGDEAARRAVAQAVGRACEEIGFLAITGHGVPEELTQRTAAAARRFFDLPAEVKRAVPLTAAGAGYSPLQGERLAASRGEATPPDLKESFNVSADAAGNVWPAEPRELQPVLTAYFRAMTELAEMLMRIFAAALGLPEDTFADKINRPQSFLRVIHYPAPAEAPLPGQLRAGAHADYGTLTILRSENVAGGLQVLAKDGTWLDVPVPLNGYILNIGDMLMRWTNGRWVSTVHRVVNPPLEQWRSSRRQSLVFFHNPNAEALIDCLPGCCDAAHPPQYAPVRAGEFLAEKARQAYGA
jgi:isopenicillin N synthase-like dioxygenase